MAALNLPKSVIKRLRRIAAYKRLFLDEHGLLTPDAMMVLDDLYDFTKLFDPKTVDPQALTVLEGGRKVVRHILDRTKTGESEMRRYLTISIGDDNE
jgi:hypothetical protein